MVRFGSGVDTITEVLTSAGPSEDVDVVFFEGMSSSDITSIERSGYNLVMRFGQGDVLVNRDYFYPYSPSSATTRVERFEFASGEAWTEADIKSRVIMAGTEVANSISGSGDDDRIHGYGGDDSLYGSSGNDALYGGTGNDALRGDDGNDILDGGAGNDTLTGSAGSDRYIVRIGSGIDTLDEKREPQTSVDVDVLFFEGMLSSHITALERYGSNLVVKFGDGDQVTNVNFFAAYSPATDTAAVERFEFSDGEVWDRAAILARFVTLGNEASNSLSGLDSSDRIYGLGGDDSLYGYGGDDLPDGGAGADAINGHAGNDLLYGNEGNDTLDGGANNDVLDGGAGNDALNGDAGADRYVVRLGSGVDTISEARTAASTDVDVLFFEGMSSSDITSLERSGYSLIVGFGSGDQVINANYIHTARRRTRPGSNGSSSAAARSGLRRM